MTSPVVLLQSPFMFCCCAAVSGIDQFGSVIPHFVFPSIPWFSGLPSSSETSFQKFLLGDSVVENAYYIPSPMFRTSSSHLFLGFPACLLPPRLPPRFIFFGGDSVIENYYYMPSPLLSFGAHVRNQARVCTVCAVLYCTMFSRCH